VIELRTIAADVDQVAARATAALETPTGGRALVLFAAGWILLTTRGWGFPAPDGFPFIVLWIAGSAAALSAITVARRRRPRVFVAIVVLLGVAMALAAGTLTVSQPLRDLHLYLKAGRHWLDGSTVYLDHLLTAVPVDRSDYPFLYPPATLPLFAALASLPRPIVDAAWVAGSAALGVAALRSWGFSTRWAIAALIWPPFFQGLWVGNVAVPLVALFAWAPRAGGLLVVGPLFKAYSAVATLWLVRERRWLALVAGLAFVAVVILATLPLVGFDLWRQWLVGLEWFGRSQPLLPASLYGFGLVQYLGPGMALAVGAIVLVMAIAARRLPGLARLGIATVVVSPSLYAHGMLVAIPGLLALRPVWLWIALTILSAGMDQWFAAVALAIGAWWLPALRRTAEPRLAITGNPLEGGPGPWSDSTPPTSPRTD
jgi:hypothetical protein